MDLSVGDLLGICELAGIKAKCEKLTSLETIFTVEHMRITQDRKTYTGKFVYEKLNKDCNYYPLGDLIEDIAEEKKDVR